MYHGKYENKPKLSLLTWVLVCAALLATVIGGASAYLSMSADLQNDFSTAPHPEVTVSGTTVVVDPHGYAVYLRVAVDANWKNATDGTILADEPAVTFNLGTEWKKIGEFYYYSSKISGTNGTTISLPITQPTEQKDGYQLEIAVAAQVVQALGTTDDGTKSAVESAWGVTPAQIEGEGTP